MDNHPIKTLAWVQTCQEFGLSVSDYIALRKEAKIPVDVAYAPTLLSTFDHWDTPTIATWSILVKENESPPSLLLGWIMDRSARMTENEFLFAMEHVAQWRFTPNRVVANLPESLFPLFLQQCVRNEHARTSRHAQAPNTETLAAIRAMTPGHLAQSNKGFEWRRLGLIQWDKSVEGSQEAIARICGLLPPQAQMNYATEVISKLLPVNQPTTYPITKAVVSAGQLLVNFRTYAPDIYPSILSYTLLRRPDLLNIVPTLLDDPTIVRLFLNTDQATLTMTNRNLWNALVYHPQAPQQDRERAFVLQCIYKGATAKDIEHSTTWTPPMRDAFNIWLATAYRKHHQSSNTLLTFIGKKMVEAARQAWNVDLRNPTDFHRWETTMTSNKNPLAFVDACRSLGMDHLDETMLNTYLTQEPSPPPLQIPQGSPTEWK